MDDYSPQPIAPALDRGVDEIEEQQYEELDKQIAQAYFHKSWGAVEQMFLEQIQAYGDLSQVSPDLTATEYKIEALSNLKTKANLVAVLERIKNAVRATESNKRTGGK